MTESSKLPSMESVLREGRTHRLGVSGQAEAGTMVLQVSVGDVPASVFAEIRDRGDRVPGCTAYDPQDGVWTIAFACQYGQRLRELFERAAMDVVGRRAWLLKLVRAMAELHREGRSYGLCHPRFLLVDDVGEFRFPEPATALALMGGSSYVSQSDRLGLFQGVVEPGYVAPEWVRGDNGPTPASDVFQLGVLLAEDSLGESPFGAGLTLEVANRVLAGNAAALLRGRDRFSTQWVDALLAALQPDPLRRLGDAGQLLDALLGTAEGRGTLSPPPLAASNVPYWQQFQAMPVDTSTWRMPSASTHLATEGRLLVEQLARLKGERQSERGATDGKWGWWVFSAGLAVAAGLGFYLLPGLGDAGRRYEGTRTEGEQTITHKMAVDSGQEASNPSLTHESLLNSVPTRITRMLEQLNVPLSGESAFVPPVLPPYRVRVRGEQGHEALLEFASRDRLSRVILVGAERPQLPASYTVLYDASGEPKALLPYDPMGYVLPVVTLPEASMNVPGRQ